MRFSDNDLDWLVECLQGAARQEILPRFRQLGDSDIHEKTSGSDLVTEADVNAERVITAELTNEIRNNRQTIMCPHCERSGHEGDADYCKYCGGGLHEDPEDEDVEDEEQAKARDKLD